MKEANDVAYRTIILSGCFLFSACAEDSLLRLPDSVPMIEPTIPTWCWIHCIRYLSPQPLYSHCDGEDVSVQIENQGLWTVFVETLERQHPEVMEIVPINQRLAPGEALEVMVSALPGQHEFLSCSGTTRALSTASASRHSSCQPSPSSSPPAVPSCGS